MKEDRLIKIQREKEKEEDNGENTYTNLFSFWTKVYKNKDKNVHNCDKRKKRDNVL